MSYGPSSQGGKFGGKNYYGSSHKHGSLGSGKGKNIDSSHYQGQGHAVAGSGADGCATSAALPAISSQDLEPGDLQRITKNEISQFLTEPWFLGFKPRLGREKEACWWEWGGVI